jgi:predicted acylesterase/phospholipase RssA
MSWKQIGRLLRTVFLLRVPLITLFVLAGMGPFALRQGEQLLGNLFDLRVVDPRFLDATGNPSVIVKLSALYLFAASFAAFMLAWTAVSVINLVVHYGRIRFADPDLHLDQKRPAATFLFGFCCALVLVICTMLQTPIHWLPRYGMPLLGLLVSLIVVVAAKAVQLVLTDPKTTPHPPPYLVFPAYLFKPLERGFDTLYCWHSESLNRLKGHLNSLVQWPLEILRGAGQGYLVDCEAPAGQLTLRSGHVFAIAMSLMAFALYIIIGYLKGRIDEKPAKVPALAFFLLFLIVACWFLGELSFFFDRYRVPLLASLAVLSLATTYAPESDHFYRVQAGSKLPPLLRPSALVKDRAGPGHKRLILVATAGGGIQAAAWTARVLHGLEKVCAHQTKPENKCDLRDSIVVISGVSGGSLGAMAYARSFAPNLSPVSPDSVVANAEASAIDEVAWGWTVPDVFRAVSPWFRSQYIDRGWALEQKWSAIHQLRYDKTQAALLPAKRTKDVLLSDWAPQQGIPMPALLLNATIVELGKPLVFSTTDFPRGNDRRGLVNFYDLFQGHEHTYDIRVNTAARLSASFPYVSPAARSNIENPPVPDYHIVDGGYYDNYGVVALLAWLESAIEEAGDSQKDVHDDLADVLVLGIRPFPPPGDSKPDKTHGWGFQPVAPINGLLDVRDTGQMARDDNALALFTEYYRTRGIKVWRADFVYPSSFDAQIFKNREDYQGCLEAPLSWKLSRNQVGCIEAGWRQFRLADKSRHEVNCVLDYLNGKPTPDASLGKPESGTVFCNPGDAPSQ